MTFKKFVLLVIYPVARVLYAVCKLVRRRPDVWIFGSYSNTFSDNTKYLYTDIVAEPGSIRPIWIGGDAETINKIRAAGGEAYLRWSLTGVYFSIVGKYWFISSYVSDVNYYTSGGAVVFNLWHGIPLKKIEYDIVKGPLGDLFHTQSWFIRNVYTPATFRSPDYVLSTSDFVSSRSFSTAFGVPVEKCPALGYPRLAPFFWPEDYMQEWVARWGGSHQFLSIERGKKYVQRFVYMPTWRDDNRDFLGPAHFDPERINAVLVRLDSLLYLKLHVSTPTNVLQKFRGFSNLFVLSSDEDIYPLLPYTDLLITDYSSVYFDYLLLDKDICFYPFDLDTYSSDVRGFYHDYEQFTPGFVARDQTALLSYLEARGKYSYGAERDSLRTLLHAHVDGGAANRIKSFVYDKEKCVK